MKLRPDGLPGNARGGDGRARSLGLACLGALAIGCAGPGLPASTVPPTKPATIEPPSDLASATIAQVTPPAPEPAPVPLRVTPDAPFRAQPPAAVPDSPFVAPKFKRFKLKNGIGVILAEVHDLPLCEVHLVVKTGGGANPPEAAGLADLTANMLDEGTRVDARTASRGAASKSGSRTAVTAAPTTRSALEIAEQIGDLGATLSTGASWDASIVTLSAITRNLEPALAIWADVITHPAFADKDLTRVRDNLVTAVARRKDSPPTVAGLVLARLLFGDRHPYAWPQTGIEDSIKKLSVAEVRRFYETYYAPGNATIIAAGDVTEGELRKKLETVLRDWRPRRTPAVKIATPAAIEKKKIVLVDKPGAPQSSIRVGFLGVRRTDPDYFPIVLMNQIFGGSFYRLDMNLRERQQWTYGARSGFEMRRTPGPASAGGEFVASHTADAVGEILKEMRLMTTTEVTDEELARAKDNFVKAFPARFATRGSTAALLGELAIYGLPDTFPATYTRNIQAVTKADIQRVARKFLVPDRMVIVVVGDRSTQEGPLAKLAPVEIRDVEGNPVSARAAAAPGRNSGGDKDGARDGDKD